MRTEIIPLSQVRIAHASWHLRVVRLPWQELVAARAMMICTALSWISTMRNQGPNGTMLLEGRRVWLEVVEVS